MSHNRYNLNKDICAPEPPVASASRSNALSRPADEGTKARRGDLEPPLP